MNYQSTKEVTILQPKDFTFQTDCWLQDTEHLLEPNKFGEYVFTYQARQQHDHSLVMETLDTAKHRVEMMKSPYSNKIAKAFYRNDKGEFICNQLFAPSVDLKVQHHSELYNRVATLTCHLRDAVDGTIYINASYVHIHPQGEPKTTMMKLINDGDVLEDYHW